MIPVKFREILSALRSRAATVICATILSLASTSAVAQDTTGVGAVSGVVVNAAGQPAPDVRVCALDTASCATSDAQGAFRIGELRAGAYRLEILPLAGLPFTSEHTWNRRSNSQQSGEQQGIFPIIGFDWRF